MNIHGYKTKAGIAGLLAAGATAQVSMEWAVTLFCCSLAATFWGLYDRGRRNSRENSDRIREMKDKLKKGRLM